jgi:hypothetical protein
MKYMPNADQLGGILRAFIPGIVAASMYFGLGTEASVTATATAAVTVIVAAWSAYTNKSGTAIPPKA